MPKCYNCGCDIPSGDKTKLCDSCKKIILPFIKFMGASTSSAVRRLISNENNLRSAGVTDGGMEYLLRVCELHDRQKAEEREAREAAKTAAERKAEPIKKIEEIIEKDYSELELPLDEPLNLHREPYGKFLTPVMAALILLGAAAMLYEIVFGALSLSVILCSAGLILAGYGLRVCRHLLHDLEEIKKRFR